jgi:hypothetical protein
MSLIFIFILKDPVKNNQETEKHSFETRPDESIRDPANPGLEPGWVEEKIEKEKTRYDPVDPARPGQKSGCNPLTFFLLKQLTRTTWSKPRTRFLDQVGHRNEFENYAEKLILCMYYCE